jgi:hypothetical protein
MLSGSSGYYYSRAAQVHPCAHCFPEALEHLAKVAGEQEKRDRCVGSRASPRFGKPAARM